MAAASFFSDIALLFIVEVELTSEDLPSFYFLHKRPHFSGALRPLSLGRVNFHQLRVQIHESKYKYY